MSLTKEECEKAFNHIKTLRGSNCGEYYADYTDSGLAFDEDAQIIDKLINEHFSILESYQHLLIDYSNLSKINSEIRKENERLSQQLVECQRVLKQKQEIIDDYLKTVEIDDVKIDNIEQLPIQLVHCQEQQIVEATNTYIASLGCDIRFNRNQMIEMLEMYLNKPLKFEDLKPNMWVFDNKIKEYRKIDRVNKKYRGVEYFNTYGWFIDFEENRFYRYEVKE